MSLEALQELRAEYKRVTAKPGQNNNTFMDNFVQMPESEGMVIVRILPSKTGRIRDLFCSTRLHTINGKRVHCLRELVGERWQGKCPICEYYSWLWQESDTKAPNSDEQNVLRAEARSLKPNDRFYYNCVVKHQTGTFRNNKPNPINVPLVLSIGKQVHARILRAMLGSEEDMELPLGEVYNVENGRDFKILKKNRKGSDGQVYPYYEESKFVDPSAAGTPEQIKDWLDKMHDLQALRILKTIEDLKRDIRIHKHLEEDPNKPDIGFDPKELGISTDEAHTSVTVETKSVIIPKVAESSGISEEDAALLEDDFLKKLDQPQ